MVEKIRKRGRALAVALGILGFGGIAGTIYATCYSNVDIYYPDGTVENCTMFCTLTGGYVKTGCRPVI